jgi:protein-tyrosine phosphatase
MVNDSHPIGKRIDKKGFRQAGHVRTEEGSKQTKGIQQMNLIDLHSHILPGIDDGPESLEDSIELALDYERAGYVTVVATSHWIAGSRWVPASEQIVEGATELNRAIKENGLGLKVLPGMEIGLDPQIPDYLEDGVVLTLGGSKYVLVEMPFQRLPMGWEDIIFKITSKGYFVLLAHPERCQQLFMEQQLIEKIAHSGAYIQVNYDSFIGNSGPEAIHSARRLAIQGKIHCLASDTHDIRHRHIGSVKKAMVEIEKLVGPENLRLLSVENPGRVLRSEKLLPMKSYPKTMG